MKTPHSGILRGAFAACVVGALALGLTLAFAGENAEDAERAWLGVVLTEVNDGPVTISRVVEGSPAERAGLREGEQVLSVDGEAIESAGDLVRAIGSRQVGDAVTLEVENEEGEIRAVTAELAARERGAYAFAFRPGRAELGELNEKLAELRKKFGDGEGFAWHVAGEPGGYLGVGLIQPSDDLRRALGALEGEGVLVNQVVAESPAAEAGLRAGDFIVSVDGETVASTIDLTRLIRAREPGSSVSLGIVRDAAPMTVTATLGESKGPQGFRFGPHEMRFFDGSALESFEVDGNAIERALEEALKKLEDLEIEVEEDDEGGDVRRRILVAPRIGHVDA